MNNLKTIEWIMAELPIRILTEEHVKRIEPILPVPVALQYIGLSKDGKYMLFKNLIEEELGLYHHQAFKNYYVISIKNIDILDVAFKMGVNGVIWIIEKNTDNKYFDDIFYYKESDESRIKEQIRVSEIIGVFLGNKTPNEINIEDEDNILNIVYESYLALKQNSEFKNYFSDFMDM